MLGYIVIIAAIGLPLVLLFLTPYINIRKQKYFLIAFIAIVAILVLLPKTKLYTIRLPIINNSLNGYIMDFLNASVLFSGLTTIDPAIQSNLLTFIAPIISACVILIGVAIVAVVLSFVLFIMHLVQRRNKTFSCVVGLLLTIASAGAVVMAPVCSLVHINNTLNQTVTIKGKTLTESYPLYAEKYGTLLSLLNGIKIPDTISNPLVESVNILSRKKLDKLDTELNNVDALLTTLRDCGVTQIYTNPTFQFRNANTSTFNFDMLGKLITECHKSEIYDGLPRVFTNQILVHFENRIKSDTRKSVLEQPLEFNEADFHNQYLQLMDMLSFVVKYNLQHISENVGVSDVVSAGFSVVGGGGTSDALRIMEYPLVQKIADNADTSSIMGIEISGALYACGRLYGVLDSWLSAYRSTPEYQVVIRYLNMRNIIVTPF